MTLNAVYQRLSNSIQGLSERDRRALGLGSLIVIPVIGWLAIVQPYLGTVDRWNDRLASERALLERERALLAAEPRMAGLLKAGAAGVRQWDERLLHGTNSALAEAEMTAILESAARRNRVLLQEVATMITPPGTSSPEGVLPLRMSVRGESDYEGILNFLGTLEENAILFRIVGVSLDRPSGSAGGGGAPGGAGGAQAGQAGAMSFVAIVEGFAKLDP